MRRREGGVDAGQGLQRCRAGVRGTPALALARKRCEEPPAHLERCREALSISGIDTPIDFGCPITHEMMVDPVVASDGHSYEREALMEILEILEILGAHGDLGSTRSCHH